MNRRTKFLLGTTGLALAGAALVPAAAAAQPDTPAGDRVAAARGGLGTAALPAPDGTRLVQTTVGSGVQVYECLTGADGAATWRNRPVATLSGPGYRVTGTHDSVSRQGEAPVPQWSTLDGSRVVAQLPPLVNQPDPDPARNIAALRLGVAGNSGTGRLARVTIVQRDLVSGGVGPAGACTAGTDAPVVSPYRARYTMWAPAA